jgi:UDP-glucose 4-epimerase
VKVLVTGSSGHLGEALMRTLQAQRREAIGIDVLPGMFTRHVGSIADRAFVRRCMKGVTTVLHAATLHKPHVATHSRQDFVDVNISGSICSKKPSQPVSRRLSTPARPACSAMRWCRRRASRRPG